MSLWRKLFARDPRPWVVGTCPLCGSGEFKERAVLWPELIAEWELSPIEAAYIDRQQGRQCKRCHAQWRVMTLASSS